MVERSGVTVIGKLPATIIKTNMKRFLVADDHSIMRSAIGMLLKSEFLNAEVEECSDGHSVWKKVLSESYDLLILDISMPGLDSTSLLKNSLAHRPDLKILILSASPEEIYAKKYLQLGARGFINKTADQEEHRRAIISVLNNKRYLSSKMQDSLTLEALGGKEENPFDKLSHREKEVLLHIVEGKNITEIARLLSVHTSTVGTHKARILEKLGVSNIIELTKVAQMFDVEFGLQMKTQ
jgi:DNA-binding NarL/FixJ family response regulator